MARSLMKVVAVAVLVCGPVSAGAGVAVGAPRLPVPPIGGGSGIVIDDQAECTLTTIGHDARDRLVGLTAGHCGEPGDSVASVAYPGYGVLGRFVYADHELDYAIIEFDARRVAPAREVGGFRIDGLGAPAQFPDIVCKKGRTTGHTCGVAWGDMMGDSTDTWTQMCVLKGDSGAPVVIGSTLVGMVNAYLGIGCLGPEVGTDINAILADIDSRNSVGAGFRPV
ncbi:S1 family peptidase [Nocardia pneumoniae]|uniref:S1 family peptidase n=1 Tax=Nocardia pneumoniae TaxID=228601 RepID=UPI001FE23DD3|nr:S1 family peptidase [Nocardia pneumoniae]